MAFDFEAAVQAPFRMQPGLRRLAAGARQLTPLAPGSRHQREKLAVLSAHADDALQVAEGFDPMPALAALAAEAAREHPAALRWDGRRAEAVLLGVAIDVRGHLDVLRPGCFGLGDEVSRCLEAIAPSWRFAALLCLAFVEDFAIVDARDARIPWIAAALPSFWSPREKVGRHFAEVHAPVADAALLLKASSALVATVTGGERWERFVWTITPHARLHAHPARVDPRRWALVDPGRIVEEAWFRTERQTFIPVAPFAQAVFTIAVDVQPLAEVVADAQKAAALQAAVSSMSEAVLGYRGLAPVREPLLAALQSRAARLP